MWLTYSFSSFELFIISIISSFGLAVILVEKGDEWPVVCITKKIRFVLSIIYPKLAGLLDCTVCMSFWAALIVDFLLFVITSEKYFFWPLSGFSVAGFTWLAIQILNAIDPQEESSVEEYSDIPANEEQE